VRFAGRFACATKGTAFAAISTEGTTMGIDVSPAENRRAPGAAAPDLPDAAQALHDPHAALERALIAEFLARHGHTLQSVRRLPPAEASALLREATAFATMRLSEVDAKAHYLDELDGG
jgi:hypothetical protein